MDQDILERDSSIYKLNSYSNMETLQRRKQTRKNKPTLIYCMKYSHKVTDGQRHPLNGSK